MLAITFTLSDDLIRNRYFHTHSCSGDLHLRHLLSHYQTIVPPDTIPRVDCSQHETYWRTFLSMLWIAINHAHSVCRYPLSICQHMAILWYSSSSCIVWIPIVSSVYLNNLWLCDFICKKRTIWLKELYKSYFETIRVLSSIIKHEFIFAQ